MAYWQISRCAKLPCGVYVLIKDTHNESPLPLFRQLSLVALIRTDTYESSQSEIDYNVTFFRKAVHCIVDMENARWYGGDDII